MEMSRRSLEQIRDHYFPKRTVWSQLCSAFLKAVGAVTVAAGAQKFLEKAVELDGDTYEYRIRLEYVKDMVAINDMFDLERPLTADERRLVDDILSEAVFLQEAKPDDALPHVLASQAYVLRGEVDVARRELDKALALEPENARVRIAACSLNLDADAWSSAGDAKGAAADQKIAATLGCGSR